MIYAKPTLYRGILFRSRLEARWAVLMDSIGIKFEYEAKQFQLEDGQYLPDFWLPDIGAWLELKPGTVTGPTIDERRKAQAVSDIDHKPCFIACGFPDASRSTSIYLFLPGLKNPAITSIQCMVGFIGLVDQDYFYATALAAKNRIDCLSSMSDIVFIYLLENGIVDRYRHNREIQREPREDFGFGLPQLKSVKDVILFASNEVFGNIQCLKSA